VRAVRRSTLTVVNRTFAIVATFAIRVAALVGRRAGWTLSATLAVGALATLRSMSLRALAAWTAGAFAVALHASGGYCVHVISLLSLFESETRVCRQRFVMFVLSTPQINKSCL